jgi:hypothetical protein
LIYGPVQGNAATSPFCFIAKKVPSRAFQAIKKIRKEGYTRAENKQRDKRHATARIRRQIQRSEKRL